MTLSVFRALWYFVLPPILPKILTAKLFCLVPVLDLIIRLGPSSLSPGSHWTAPSLDWAGLLWKTTSVCTVVWPAFISPVTGPR